MAEHLRDKNLNEFIADEIGLSLGYTRNLFKTIGGAEQYIGMKRIDGRKISEYDEAVDNAIRESLGFSTPYFCTYFKSRRKIPSEYRNEQGRPSNPDYGI